MWLLDQKGTHLTMKYEVIWVRRLILCLCFNDQTPSSLFSPPIYSLREHSLVIGLLFLVSRDFFSFFLLILCVYVSCWDCVMVTDKRITVCETANVMRIIISWKSMWVGVVCETHWQLDHKSMVLCCGFPFIQPPNWLRVKYVVTN